MTQLLAQLIDLYQKFDIVDLSAVIENDIPRWPTHPPLVVHKTIYHGHDDYFTNTLFMAEHTATHCDAPAHIHANMPESTVDKLPLAAMVGRACVIDLSGLQMQAGELVEAQVILDWEANHGAIQEGDIVLLNFGWMARYWRTDSQWVYYANNSPGLAQGAVRLLYQRGVKALGSDLIACDQAIVNGVAAKSYAHDEYMLPNGRPLLEELTNLESLPPRCFVIALPLKIRGGSGSPVRAVGLVPKK